MHGAIHLFDQLHEADGAQPSGGAQPLAALRADPLVGVIRNPRSHGNEGRSADLGDLPGVLLASPRKRHELPAILADFAAKAVDLLVVDGGDGTVRDVLTCGASVFGDAWPTLIVLPSGKTNALAYDLGVAPGWTLAQALEAARRQSVAVRHPIVVAQTDNDAAQVRGFVLGAGAFTQAISLGQDAHDFGAFNAAAVGVTTAWSVLQALFGRAGNIWRRGTRIRLRGPDGAELPHAGGGPLDERYMVFASTLERFPVGLCPFKGIDAPLRMGVLDTPRRALLLCLPLIFYGRAGKAARRLGFQAHGLDRFDMEIADRFILDGEAFPAGSYQVRLGPRLHFIVP
ncbi:diacylglycerol kinase family protein [Altererythrobacter lauratis]|uniref:Diacylglycerol kinase family protein n=1 Tax=Alteraurantiacibacter lauratis TaxID=2054627 RepID=A0ABV7EFJ7_9SPHN